MYSKWLDEDNEEIEMSNEELESLKEQFKEASFCTTAHNQALS